MNFPKLLGPIELREFMSPKPKKFGQKIASIKGCSLNSSDPKNRLDRSSKVSGNISPETQGRGLTPTEEESYRGKTLLSLL
jgi:hypothetical protein